jgi:hypothetical protein
MRFDSEGSKQEVGGEKQILSCPKEERHCALVLDLPMFQPRFDKSVPTILEGIHFGYIKSFQETISCI